MRHPTTVLLLGASALACGMPPAARPAETLPAGEGSFSFYIGGSFGSERRPDAIPPEYLLNWGLTYRRGLGAGCDLGLDLGWLRQGLLGRCAILNADEGDAVSLAPAVGVAYQPGRGAEVTGGIDIGLGQLGAFRPFAHLGLAAGSYWHFVPTDDPNRHPEESKYDTRVRRELRLVTNAGTTIELGAPRFPGELGNHLVVGVGPFWILDSDETAPGEGPDLGGGPHGVLFTLGWMLR